MVGGETVTDARKSLGAVRLRQPTLLLALSLVALFLVIAELLARTSLVHDWLGMPTVGTAHAQFNIKLNLLQEFQRQGPVDCLLLGSSMVARGINSEILDQSF